MSSPGTSAPARDTSPHGTHEIGLGIIVVIPAFNEERTIESVIRGLHHVGFRRVLVINDGSSDRTEEHAVQAGAEVRTHLVNRGCGAALVTGIRAAVLRGAEVVVTCDADGQHDPEDVARVLVPVVRGDADVAIGSRLVGGGWMPLRRRIANRLADLVTFALCGVWVNDSQSGLRALSRKAAETIRIDADGMEFSSTLRVEIARHRLRCREVPISSIYTEYSLSKGQSFRVGLRTLRKLMLRKIVRTRG